MEVAHILGVLAVVCPRLALVLVLERRAARTSLSRQPRGSIVAEKVIGSGRAGSRAWRGAGDGAGQAKYRRGCAVCCMVYAVGVMARGWPARETAGRRETCVRHDAVADRTPDRVAK